MELLYNSFLPALWHQNTGKGLFRSTILTVIELLSCLTFCSSCSLSCFKSELHLSSFCFSSSFAEKQSIKQNILNIYLTIVDRGSKLLHVKWEIVFKPMLNNLCTESLPEFTYIHKHDRLKKYSDCYFHFISD